ncbi:MAG: MATE family efflux transporter [Planctomycetia bacterium]|nr:MATE family efflux transporter [Planctomycetia bacterium]
MNVIEIETEGTMRPMLRLAMPALAEQVLGSLIVLVDMWLTGHYLPGVARLAAISLIIYAMWLLSSLFEFVGIGAMALVARGVGAGDMPRARRVTHQALLLGTLLAAAGTVVGYLSVRWFVHVMQLRGEAAYLAVEYLHIILPALLLIMIVRVGVACLRGAGDMIGSMLTMGIVNIVNIVVASALVIGIGPIQTIGWRGLPIGAVCGYAAGAVMILVMFAKRRAGLSLHWHLFVPDKALMRRVLRIGIPGGIDMLMIVCCNLWFLSLVNSLGDLATAAHGVGVRIESLAFLPGAAFQMAAATLAGQYLGAGDSRRASRSVWSACLAGCGLMGVIGVLFLFNGSALARFFISADRGDVIALTAQLLWIVGWAMPALGLQMILTGALRGAGDTRWPMLFSMIGFLGVRLPMTYYMLGWTSVGLKGAWYAMVLDIFIRCGLVAYRFFHGGWKRVRV